MKKNNAQPDFAGKKRNVSLQPIKNIIRAGWLFLVLLAGTPPDRAYSQAVLDIETGLVFSGYNDVGIPGDMGTRFSLHDDLEPETAVFFRARASYTLNSRHTFSLLAAPFTIRYGGPLVHEVTFAGKTFPAGTEVDAEYKFNSYRLTYRYELYSSKRFEAGLGLTGKIRDAEIRLEDSTGEAGKSNIGFVPLINFRLFFSPRERTGFLLEGDALAAMQGRAEDVLIAFTYDLSNRFRARIGYRILEGGADNDQVYNFAFFNYTLFGLEARL
jgi:hypothetical protein